MLLLFQQLEFHKQTPGDGLIGRLPGKILGSVKQHEAALAVGNIKDSLDFSFRHE